MDFKKSNPERVVLLLGNLYIGSEVVIIFDDVRIPYIVKAEPVAESGSGIVTKAISQASDSRRRLRC